MATDLIPATVVLGRRSVVVYLNVPDDAVHLSKMLLPGSKVSIEQVFTAPASGGGPGAEAPAEMLATPSRKRNGSSEANVATASRKAPALPSDGLCRGVTVLTDIQHGPPGRGRALGFCTECTKKIPRATRLEMYAKAKGKAPTGGADESVEENEG